MQYIPLNIKSHYSLLQSIIKPQDLKGLDFRIGFCDINNISSAVQFNKEIPNAIIGIDINIQGRGSLCILSKNYEGWTSLIKISSFVNSKESQKNGVSYLDIQKFYNHNLIFIYKYPEMLTVPEYWYGVDINNNNTFLRQIKPDKCVAFHSCLIKSQDQMQDLEILYSIKDNISAEECHQKYANIFKNKRYDIMTYEEMLNIGYSKEELANTLKIANVCTEYKITKGLILPKFPIETNISSDEYLTELCRQGWREKELNNKTNSEIYRRRVLEELSVIKEYQLSDYFLIVQDILNYVEKNII